MDTLRRRTANHAPTPPVGIDALVARMQRLLAPLQADEDPRRFFLATYLRITTAVRDELAAGGFQDAEWVERWDLRFAGLYLDALEAHDRGAPVPRPWAAAFSAGPRLAPMRHVLLGTNAHVNFDLPQALLSVISSKDFDDPGLMRSRHLDHAHVDAVLAARVAAEDAELTRLGGRLSDRILRPLNRAGTRRFLAESRRKVWANVALLDAARRRGAFALAESLGQLEQLSAARVGQLMAPGPVVLRLAVGGFGVELPATNQRWP